MEIHALRAFNDNYIWCLTADHEVCVVDPGDATPVLDYLRSSGLRLTAILITHHHFDHVGGVAELKRQTGCTVYGPNHPAIEGIDHHVGDGDRVAIMGLELDVLGVPGHTLDHIAYLWPGADGAASSAPWLFCGDTLFAAGCGRLFEGDAATMRRSLSRLRELPATTEIYCAHEYTQSNLRFAAAVEPDNLAIQQRIATVDALRAEDRITLPSTLGEERATNPFLRWDDEAVIAAARRQQPGAHNSDEVFAAIRGWKDQF